MTTIAVIPCHNEARHIGVVVKGALRYVDAVIVSDDGSTDGTALSAADAGAGVVGLNERFGAGSVVRLGVMNALALSADILILLDGDGQHDPSDIPALLKPIQDGVADVVMGSRLGKHDRRPLYRRISNHIGTWLANFDSLSNQRVSDAITGFWAIKANKMPVLAEKGWGWAIELLMKCRAKRLRIISIPIKAIWHNDAKENSGAQPLWLGLILFYKIIKWRLECVV